MTPSNLSLTLGLVFLALVGIGLIRCEIRRRRESFDAVQLRHYFSAIVAGASLGAGFVYGGIPSHIAWAVPLFGLPAVILSFFNLWRDTRDGVFDSAETQNSKSSELQ